MSSLAPPTVPPSPTGSSEHLGLARRPSNDSKLDVSAIDEALAEVDTATSKTQSREDAESEAESESESEADAEVDEAPPLPSSAPIRATRASMPAQPRLPHSQPPRFGARPSVTPIVSLRSLTQDYVRSAVTAPSNSGSHIQSRPSAGRNQARKRYADQESEEEEEEEDDESSDDSDKSPPAPPLNKIPPHRRAGSGMMKRAFQSLTYSMFPPSSS